MSQTVCDARSGNRVKSPGSERMAATYTTNRQPSTTQRAVALQRLNRICGAGRIIAARTAQHGRENQLIATNTQDERATRPLLKRRHGCPTAKWWQKVRPVPQPADLPPAAASTCALLRGDLQTRACTHGEIPAAPHRPSAAREASPLEQFRAGDALRDYDRLRCARSAAQ